MADTFEREERFIVIKRKHLSPAKEEALRTYLHDDNIGTVECVVVESDWPEYETIWKIIEARVNPEPIVRAVYEARPFKVISEALSEATGLPMDAPISWDAFIAAGGDPSGLRWHVEQVLAALGAAA